jgi:polyisoprenoid-binding protein YceI
MLLHQVGPPRTWGRMPRLLIVVALALPSLARAATWNLDPAHTSVQFSVRHLMVSTVRGAFGKLSGTVQVEEKDLTRSKIQATIDAASIDTRVEKRDTHLKSPDFLDVARYPTIVFVSKKVEAGAPGHFKVIGDLTLHGVTREVSLDVEGPTPEIKDPRGNTRAGAQATTTIHRKDFGLTWNQVLEAGGVAVGDEVTITIDVEATKQTAAGG